MKAPNDKAWQRMVCERDDYVCQVCKRKFNYPYYFNDMGVNQFVCGHHIKTKKAHPELRLETDNGTTLCFTCHSRLHNGG